MTLIQGALSRTATTAADMDAARAEKRQADDRRRLEFECDEATRDVLLKASVLVDMADRGFDIEGRHFEPLREAVHRRDAAIAAKREAREHRSNS